MQKIIEIEQHLLFFIDFFRVPKYRVRPINTSAFTTTEGCSFIGYIILGVIILLDKKYISENRSQN